MNFVYTACATLIARKPDKFLDSRVD